MRDLFRGLVSELGLLESIWFLIISTHLSATTNSPYSFLSSIATSPVFWFLFLASSLITSPILTMGILSFLAVLETILFPDPGNPVIPIIFMVSLCLCVSLKFFYGIHLSFLYC